MGIWCRDSILRYYKLYILILTGFNLSLYRSLPYPFILYSLLLSMCISYIVCPYLLSLSRFWVALRFQQSHFSRQFGRPATVEELVIDSGMIVWAYHSDCQENLFGSVLPNEPSWQEMRKLGIGFWFTNVAQLRTKVIFGYA